MLMALLMLLPTAQGERLPLLFLAVFVFGWGIGSHNVHLGARTMGAALKGEEAITAASQSMVRSLGGAVGTAAAGIVANLVGLGNRIDIETVNGATLAIYLAAMVPTALGLLFVTRFTRLVVPRSRSTTNSSNSVVESAWWISAQRSSGDRTRPA